MLLPLVGPLQVRRLAIGKLTQDRDRIRGKLVPVRDKILVKIAQVTGRILGKEDRMHDRIRRKIGPIDAKTGGVRFVIHSTTIILVRTSIKTTPTRPDGV